jgi:hypothetical protein
MSGSDPESSARRIIFRASLLLLPLVGLALGVPYLMHWRPSLPELPPAGDRPATDDEIKAARKAEDRLHDAEKSWQHSSIIAGEDAVLDASGERVRRFEGFGVSVESRPPGAEVRVNGKALGETPLVASVDCTPGERVEVEVKKGSRAPVRQTTRCRKDQLVELSVELR